MSSSLTRTGPCSADRESADFPTLDVDVGADFRAQSAAAKRVCIATSEINGVVGSGGIGTAYYHLARHLAEWGHDVVIAYVNEKAADKRLMEDARALYARFDIAFEPIAPRRFGDSVREQVSASTMTLLDWVRARERPFDIVHVSERHGLGYGLLLAKSLGMAFGSTHFVVKGSSPLLWLAEANRRFLSSEYELGVVFMEKRSVELADTVICDSARLLEWMHGAGYAIPARSFVWPDPPRIADPSPAEAAERVSCDGALEVWEHWHAQAAHFEAAAERFSERERTAGTGMPLVTVCIVHYERPELVRMAVDSVLAQDYSAVEAVLVDDGSEGAEARATLDALEPDFLRRGWRLIRQENRYLGAARNAAAAAARGEWLLFLDDDNVLFPDAVSRLVRAARFSGADCITAASIRFSGKGDPRLDTRSHRHAPIRFFGAAIASNLFHNVIGDACALVRRSAFEAAGGFAEVYGLALEDMEFFNRLSLAGHRVEYMPDTTFYKRVLPASMIRSSDRSSARHRHFVTMPYLSGLSAEERALASIAIGSIDQSGVPKRLAESAMRRGNWAAARELWEELRQAFPDDSSGYVRGTVALLGAGCLEEAECLAVEALERFPDHSGAHVQRAEVAMRREDWSLASAMWADLREVFPYHTSGYVRGATALLGAGRLEEAEKLAVEAVSRFPDRPGGYAQHAEVAMRHEDWEAACDRWREVHEMFPDHAAGYVRGAEALLAAGRLEEAEALAVEAVSRFPEHVGGYVQRAEVAMRREDWAVAVRYWESVRGAFPDEASGYERCTVALMEAGRWEAAEGLAGEAVERFPERRGSYVRRAELAIRRGDWAAAVRYWEAVRGGFPDEASGHVRGAEALLAAGRLEEAEALAVEAVSRFPEHVGGYVQRAEVAMRREDWSLASAMWADLREVFPYHTSGYVRGATALLGAGRLEEAEKLAVEAVSRFPDRPGGYAQHAEVAMRHEDWEAACDRWREVHEMFPDHAAGYVRGAEALLAAGRLEEAEALAVEAVSRFPEHVGGYVQRAEVAMRREDWAVAVRYWESVRQAFPDEASGYERCTVALMEAGRWEAAEGLAGEAVERFPERRGSYVRRAELAIRRGDWAAAVRYWEAVRGGFPDEASGHVRGAEALLAAGRLEEAEALAVEAVSRFPEHVGGYVQRAEVAMRREDWAVAVRYWESDAKRFRRRSVARSRWRRVEWRRRSGGGRSGGSVSPSVAGATFVGRSDTAGTGRGGPVLGCVSREASGHVRGAEALLAAGRRGGGSVGGRGGVTLSRGRGVLQRAEVAMRREDWAVRYWESVRQAFPDEASGYERCTVALMERVEWRLAEALAEDAVAFPRASRELRSSGGAGDTPRGLGGGGPVLGGGARGVSRRGLGACARGGGVAGGRSAGGGGSVGGRGGVTLSRARRGVCAACRGGDASRGLGGGGPVLGVGTPSVSG